MGQSVEKWAYRELQDDVGDANIRAALIVVNTRNEGEADIVKSAEVNALRIDTFVSPGIIVAAIGAVLGDGS